MKNTSSFEHALIVILMAGFSVAAANGQSQKTPHLKHASNFVADGDASPVKRDTISVTTKSADARRDYEMGMMHYEDLLLVDEGLDFLRDAVKTDPHFALGHAMLGFATFDPAEANRHRALSKQFIANASPDERLQIRWLNGTKDGQIVPAIAAIDAAMGSCRRATRFSPAMSAARKVASLCIWLKAAGTVITVPVPEALRTSSGR